MEERLLVRRAASASNGRAGATQCLMEKQGAKQDVVARYGGVPLDDGGGRWVLPGMCTVVVCRLGPATASAGSSARTTKSDVLQVELSSVGVATNEMTKTNGV